MEANLFEKIGIVLKNSTSSILFLEIIVIFAILLLFLLLNLKYQKKQISIFLTIFLLYFLISVGIIFHQELYLATREIVKKIVEYFYFSPIPIYFLTVLIVSFCLVKTMFAKGYTKRHKILSYLLLLPILFCFVSFVVVAKSEKIAIHELTAVYQNEVTLSIVQVSQTIFFLYLFTCFFRWLYHYTRDKIVK